MSKDSRVEHSTRTLQTLALLLLGAVGFDYQSSCLLFRTRFFVVSGPYPAFSQAVASGFPPELGASFAVCFSIHDAVIA